MTYQPQPTSTTRRSDHTTPSPAMTLRAMYARCSDSEPIVFADDTTPRDRTPTDEQHSSPAGPPSRMGSSSPLASSDRNYNNRRQHDATQQQQLPAAVVNDTQLMKAVRCRSSPAAANTSSTTTTNRPPSAGQYAVGALRAQLTRPTSASRIHVEKTPQPALVSSSSLLLEQRQHPLYHPRPPSASRTQQQHHLPPVTTTSVVGGATTSFCSNTDSPRSALSTQASMNATSEQQSINSQAGNPYAPSAAVRSVGSSSILTALRTFSSSELSHNNAVNAAAAAANHVAMRRLDSSTRRAIASSSTASPRLQVPSVDDASTSPIGFSISHLNSNTSNNTPNNELQGMPLGMSAMTSSSSAAAQPHHPNSIVISSSSASGGGQPQQHKIVVPLTDKHVPAATVAKLPIAGDSSFGARSSDETPPMQRVLTALPLITTGSSGNNNSSNNAPLQLQKPALESSSATTPDGKQTRMVFASWVPMTLEGSTEGILVSPMHPIHRVAEAVTTNRRIEEFLQTVEGGDGSISPSNPVQDFLTNSIEAAMAVSGLSKPPTELDDLTVSMRPLSVHYLWLLFRVYVRLRMFVHRWRRLHLRKPDGTAFSAKQKDQVQELMTTLDSANWVHVFNIRWQEKQIGITVDGGVVSSNTPTTSSNCSSAAGVLAATGSPNTRGGGGVADEDDNEDETTTPIPFSSSPLDEGSSSTTGTTASNAVITTTIHVPDIPVYNNTNKRRGSRDRSSGAASTISVRSRTSTARTDGFERAMLHLSTSHLYVSSVNSTASWTLRLNDVLKVVPKPTGVEIHYAGPPAPAVVAAAAPTAATTAAAAPADVPIIWFDGTQPHQSTKSLLSTSNALSATPTVISGEDIAEPANTLKSTPSGYFHFGGNEKETSSRNQRSKSPQSHLFAVHNTSGAASSSGRSPLQPPSTGAAWNGEASTNAAHLVSGSFDNVTATTTTNNNSTSFTTRRIVFHTTDITSITHSILELQAMYLRGFSMSLADRLLLKHQTRTLHIVHFNDVYHLPPFKPATARGVVGGAGRFHTVLAKLRETTNPLVLFSGDFMGPSLMSVITKGKQMVDALNFLGVHYGCFGNHEFDFGLRVLKEVIHGYTQGKHIYTGSQTKWVMSNMVEGDTNDGEPPIPLGGAKPYEITIWNNIKIGILGLCENWLPQCANLQPSEATYLDMFEIGEKLAVYLKEVEGAELVFALTHNRNINDRELAVRCPTIDYIFGGHDHKFKSEPKYRFLKSGQEFEYLSTIEVILAPNRKPKYKIDCIPITYDIKESDYLQGLITRYDAKMAEKLGRVIGKSDVQLDSTEETVRFKEGMLTNFILDVIQSTMETDLAFLGAAAISGKEIMPAGNVTLGDIFGWFPNETKIMTMKLKGSTIKKTLDVMVRELPAEAPSFPHPSQQLRFTINMMRKPPIVEDIFIRGQPLDYNREYLCAVEDFVGIGKAKYKHVAAEGQVILGEDDAVQVVTMVRDFFLKRKASDVDAKEAAALKNVTKIVSSATHIGVDMDMAKSQRFVRSLICELMHCDKSSIFLVNQADQTIHFMPDPKGDQKPTTITMPLGVGLAGSCATLCEVLNIEDCYEDPRFNSAIDRSTGYRTKTMLCVPVLLDGKTCSAVVQAINKDNDALFDEIDEISLRVLGEQVSFQLRYQTIFQESRKELEFHAEWVLDVFRSMTSEVCLDLVSGLRVVQSHAASAFKCDNVRVFRFEDNEDDGAASRIGKPASSQSSGQPGAQPRVLYMEEGLDDETIIVPADIHPNSFIAELARSKTQRLIKDASKMMILRPNDNLSCRSVLGIPLISSIGTCVGFIVAYDKPRGFQHDDEVIGGYLGRISAVAMENCVRLQKILAASSETTLPTVPTLPVDRIRVKGGWATPRRAFKFAKAERAYLLKVGLPMIPMHAFFHSEEKSMFPDTTATMELTVSPSTGGVAMFLAKEPTVVVEGPSEANDNSGNGNSGNGQLAAVKTKSKHNALASLWGKVRRAGGASDADAATYDTSERSSRVPSTNFLPVPGPAAAAAARKRSSITNHSITALFIASSDEKPLGNIESQRTPRPSGMEDEAIQRTPRPTTVEDANPIPPSQRHRSRRFTFSLEDDASTSASAEQLVPAQTFTVEVDAPMPSVGVEEWDTEQQPSEPLAVPVPA